MYIHVYTCIGLYGTNALAPRLWEQLPHHLPVLHFPRLAHPQRQAWLHVRSRLCGFRGLLVQPTQNTENN